MIIPALSNAELIAQAAAIAKPKRVGVHWIGDVGCVLISDSNTVYRGVCIDTGSSLGFCAEHSAIAAMITAGEYRIRTIVAVWRNEGQTAILAPCGRCREFMRQIDPANLQTTVILDFDKVLTLTELLPYHDWFHIIPNLDRQT